MLLSLWLEGLLFTNNLLLHKNSKESTSGAVVEEIKIPYSSNFTEAKMRREV
jgi:hypothetical protein